MRNDEGLRGVTDPANEGAGQHPTHHSCYPSVNPYTDEIFSIRINSEGDRVEVDLNITLQRQLHNTIPTSGCTRDVYSTGVHPPRNPSVRWVVSPLFGIHD